MASIEKMDETETEIKELFKNINTLRKDINEYILQKDENKILQNQIDELDDLFSAVEFYVRNEVRSIETEHGSCILITDTQDDKQYPGYYKVKFNLIEITPQR